MLTLGVGLLAIRHRRKSGFILKAAIIAGVGIVAQVGLGAAVVLIELQPFLIVAHLAMAFGFLATMIIVSVAAQRVSRSPPGAPVITGEGPKRLLAAAIAGMFVLLLVGAFAGGSGARAGCAGWPLCNGQIVPVGDLAGNWQVWVIFAHRVLSIPVVALVLRTGWRLRQSDSRSLRIHGTLAMTWMLVEIGLGALNPLTAFDIGVAVAHLGVAAIIWTHLVAAAAIGPDFLQGSIARASAR